MDISDVKYIITISLRDMTADIQLPVVFVH